MARIEGTTFTALLQTNAQKLEALGYSPNQKITELQTEVSATARALFEDHQTLLTAQDRTPLIEAYGREQWEKQFVRLSDVPEKERAAVWKAVRNSRYGRFQRLFCKTEDRCVPCYVMRGKTPLFASGMNFNTLTLRGCLVSPDRIPDQLAVDLGLCDFTEEFGDPRARLLKKEPVIPALIDLWEHTVQIQEKNHRLLRVETADDETSPVLGSVLYTREDDRRERSDDALKAQFFPSAYNVHRKPMHEAAVYRKEIGTITDVIGQLNQLNGDLDAEWKATAAATRKTELRVAAFMVCGECRKLLDGCQNIFKQEALTFLATLEGTLAEANPKKPNVSACMSKMVGAKKRLETRFEEICGKGSFNERDKMAMQFAIDLQEPAIKEFRAQVKESAGVLQKKLEARDTLFPAETLPQVTMRDLGINVRLLDGLNLQPFRTYAMGMRRQMARLQDALTVREQEPAVDALVKMHVIGKLQAVRTCFSRIEEIFVESHPLNVGKMQKYIEKLRAIFADRSVFPEHLVREWEDTFVKVEHIVSDLVVDDTPATHDLLVEMIEELDVEALVRELSVPPPVDQPQPA